jgi:hypothetical protein
MRQHRLASPKGLVRFQSAGPTFSMICDSEGAGGLVFKIEMQVLPSACRVMIGERSRAPRPALACCTHVIRARAGRR